MDRFLAPIADRCNISVMVFIQRFRCGTINPQLAPKS
jgi:hypothetical protein